MFRRFWNYLGVSGEENWLQARVESQTVHRDQTARPPLKARKLRPGITRSRYAARNTGAGGCDGRISANATWMMPPASPSATPMRQAKV